jgi:uncharacterized membrane protein
VTRVIAPAASFALVVREALPSIRHYAGSNPEVLAATLRAIRAAAPELRRAEDRAVLVDEARAALAASATWTDQREKTTVQREFEGAVRALGAQD